jgi:8-oxo-dGTP pyrophosphatase MutT (NUDIX family)
MGMSPFVAGLRAAVGDGLLLLPSVAVLPRDDARRILLVRHRHDGNWATIGGTVEPGEAPVDAARREALEEAGVDVEIGTVLAALGGPAYEVTYPNGDRVAYVATVYDARVVGGTERADHDETTEVGWFSVAELQALPMGELNRTLVTELEERGLLA